MTTVLSPFKNPQGEAEFMAAYEASLKLWPVPVEPMDFTGRYGRTHLVAAGPKDAPALVLLHGASTSLTMWAPNIADLSRNHRVYALDVMGQPGKSVPDEPLQNREDCVSWLTEVLDALQLERANLVGMSFGGWFTLNYALGTPERVNKIALLSPAGSLRPLVAQFWLRAILLAFIPRRVVAESFMRWMTYQEHLRDANTLVRYNCMVDQIYLGARYFRAQAAVRPSVFSDEELRGLRVPTLLMIGEQEALYDPVAALERARRLIPHLEGELVARASHDMATNQHGIVDRRVLDFFGESERLWAKLE